MVRSQTSILAPKSAQTLRAASSGRSLGMAIVISGVRIMDVSSGRATQQAKNHAIERQKLDMKVALMCHSYDKIMNMNYNKNNHNHKDNIKHDHSPQVLNSLSQKY